MTAEGRIANRPAPDVDRVDREVRRRFDQVSWFRMRQTPIRLG
jgi:hypothetical protein